MTHDRGEKVPFLPLIVETVADLSDLVRKEARLAAAELGAKAAATARGAVALALAGVLAFVGFLAFSAGLVLAIALSGLALIWCCFIVAALYFALAGVIAVTARRKIGLAPRRALAQLRKDAELARERPR